MKPLHAMLAIILIFSSAYLMGSVTRSISAARDNMDSQICNSRGNYWEVSGANLQAAIDDLNVSAPPHGGWGGPHGTVWLPANTAIIVDSTIVVEDYVTLDLQGSTISPSGDFDVVELRIGAQIRNGIIDVSSVSNFDHAAIAFRETDYAGVRNHMPRIHQMDLISEGLRGKGIHLHSVGSEAQTYIAEFYDIKTREFEYGILINHTGSNAFLNGQLFSNIVGYGDKYFITVTESDSEAAGNHFQNLQCHCTSDTEYIIWNNGQGNVFDNVVAYNWDNNGGTRTSYNFAENRPGDGHYAADQCFLSFRGGSDDVAMGGWDSGGSDKNRYIVVDLEKSNLTLGTVVGG